MQIKTGIITQERRKFLKDTGTFTAIAITGLTMFSCSSDDDITPTPPENIDGNINAGDGIVATSQEIRINLEIQTGLLSDGAWLLIPEVRTLVLNDNGQFKALTSVCTHASCDNAWSFSNSELTCNCHGSKFDTNGTVTRGPATRNLAQFQTSLEEDILVIAR